LGAVVVAVAAVAVVLLRSGSDYKIHARFQNASQLVKGDNVQVAGAPVGSVSAIKLTDNGQADITLNITDDRYKPLHVGTQAVVRQASLSGVANRYVDLFLPGGNPPKIDNGGTITEDQTTTAVDLDQLFNTFDPKTRKALSGVIRGYAGSYAGRGQQANAGWAYLNPALASSSRLFSDFITSSSKLVTDVAQRRDDLAGLVDNLATTTGAIGRKQQSLSDAIGQFPGFMRRANTTFVNLRATLNDLEPLVNESKPVARKLRPFLAELRPLARNARPTLADLSRLVRSPGSANDLIDLANSSVPVRDIAVGSAQRNGKNRQGALPATTQALAQSAPELATARPYAPELTGWFDDFSHSGIYDALGGASRAAPNVNLFASVNGVLAPLLDPLAQQEAYKKNLSLNQRDRCPGSLERGALWKPTANFPCDASQGPLGR
jgi:phospholipid/cholesterol/gamma-HCH transport system substrate-binding protein